ncbi:MAG: indole-3-glycerol phosphate synthase [Myxococcota bacterium]|jgi:indole-3-glycerol phosphate synthase
MNYLDDILERKKWEVKDRSHDLDLGALQRRLTRSDKDVLGALRRSDRISVIAEHKRKSPSKGFIRPESDPAEIARQYEAAGASAMSVLTDDEGFGGSADDLRAARAAVDLPLLCKDFVITPQQVFEARDWGADIVLLIVAALSKGALASLLSVTRGLGMTPLVEVHDSHELDRALSLGCKLVGVNNRNLHSFEVSLDISETLATRFPADVVRVSESGIRNSKDVRRIREAGYDAVLVGEHFMRSEHPGTALTELIEASS